MINSPVCTGRILLFPNLVLLTDLGTVGLERRAIELHRVPMCLPVVFSHLRLLRVISVAAALLKELERDASRSPDGRKLDAVVTRSFILMSSSSLSLCFLSLSAASHPVKARYQNPP